jgi:glycosyltransferase involved in cell wall biosynthesis
MRIAYCTNVRLPSERAHGHQVAKVTSALRTLDHEVEIFAPYRKNTISESFDSYYRLPKPARLTHVGSFDGIAAWWTPGIIGLKLTTYFFGKSLQKSLKERKKEFDLLYTRTPELLPFLVDLGLPVVMELHRIPRLGLGRFLKLLRKCTLVVALTNGMRQSLIDMGVSNVPIIVEGDAVDLHDFEELPDAKSTRLSLGVPEKTPLIVYTGQLKSMGLSKGVPELLNALASLHRRGLDFRAVIAGGPDDVKTQFEQSLSDELRLLVQFTGHLPHIKIPTLLTAADVLVYPAPKSTHPFYMRDTSPLKIFEYMAAGKPLVTADLPPIRDVLDESQATFFPAGDADALSKAIMEVLENAASSQKKAKVARVHVEQFTWEKRMQRILAAARLS